MAQHLAQRLGLEKYFPWKDYAEVLDWQLQQVGSSLEEMQRIGVKPFPRKTAMYFEEGKTRRFNTPSGRIELYSELLADYGQDPLPRYTPPQSPPPNHYQLIYGRAPAHTFGRTTNNPVLFELMPENHVWVSPRVAGDHGIGNADYVRLKNQDGVLSNRIRVRVTERVAPNAVFMVHGFGHDAKGMRLTHGVGADDSALITNVKIDPIAGSTGMRANFVTLIKDTGGDTA